MKLSFSAIMATAAILTTCFYTPIALAQESDALSSNLPQKQTSYKVKKGDTLWDIGNEIQLAYSRKLRHHPKDSTGIAVTSEAGETIESETASGDAVTDTVSHVSPTS